MSEKKIYVASSWRNEHQPEVVRVLRGVPGLDVYDFRNPQGSPTEPGNGPGTGFHWSEVDPAWREWTPKALEAALAHPRAQDGFDSDCVACEGADATLLVLPCGRSAHLELGVAVGRGQRTAIFWPPGIPRQEPELMYKWVGAFLMSWEDVEAWGRGL